MSFSSVPLALLDPPNVMQGFWRSHGPHLPKGPMLTMSAFRFTFLSSGIALLLGWAISRLWRFLEVIVFCIVLKKSKKSLDQSQCAVLLVNTKAPLDAFYMSIQLMRPRGPYGTAAIIFCTASVILAATIAIPAMIALLPVYQQGILIPVYYMNPSERMHSGVVSKQIQLADTVLSLLDRGSLNSSLKSVSQTAQIPIPALSHSYVKECPANATCHPAFPFTFSSNYTLHSSHFGLNIKSPFSVSIYDTCYRPPQAVVVLDHTDDPFEFALLYGPRKLNTISHNVYTNQTEVVHREDFSTGQYRLTQYSVRADTNDDSWEPNSTLILGGDTTILFYFVGGIAMSQGPPSTDPIFARKQHIRTPDQFGDWFVDTQDLVVPIICDTKYRICVNGDVDCSPVGGWMVIRAWETLHYEKTRQLGTFLYEALKIPPISRASLGSNAVAASHTVFNNPGQDQFTDPGQDQTDPGNATVIRELSRLAQAGMAILASGIQLQTLGYWTPPEERSAENTYKYCNNQLPGSFCGTVIIDNPSVFTIPLIPYTILLVMVFVIIIVSYMGTMRFMRRFAYWRKYTELWSLHYAGQLHREIVEQIGGTLCNVDVTHEWPNFNEARVGLDIVEKHGSKRFGPVTPPSIASNPSKRTDRHVKRQREII